MKTRFCPSPTGEMHLGNTRTALFSFLLAHHAKGTFLLRIEDTDQVRSGESHTNQLMTDLQWLGLQWDEGPALDRGHGPYWQSQRAAIYNQYYQQLIAQKVVYPCFCTDQQLAIARKVQLSSGKPPRYAGTCLRLTESERATKLAQGVQPTLRFHVADDTVIEFEDYIRGSQKFLGVDIGDFIIRRADGSSSFLFCNAVDDALMGVDHVLRGDDHLANTPRQLLILRALQLPIPQYGHLPLILGQDGSPLSKRNGSQSVRQLAELGFLPLAIINYLARLGHHYEDNNWLDLESLAVKFEISHLGRAPARFDEAQLKYWQKETVNRLSQAAFVAWSQNNAIAHLDLATQQLFYELVLPNVLFPADVAKWADILLTTKLQYDHESLRLLRQTEQLFFDNLIAAITQYGNDYTAICQYLKQTTKVTGKALFQPLRVALTGQLHGPELAGVVKFLGKENMLSRVALALRACVAV